MTTRAASPVMILLVSGLVFAGVLLSTPPGPMALPDLILGPARGVRGAAEAYAVGAAASLSLVTLLVVASLAGAIKLASRWLAR